MDETIKNFLDERISKRIKGALNNLKKKRNVTSEDEVVIEANAKKEYSLANWLMHASTYAEKLSLVSHPCKFSHPDANTSPVLSVLSRENDGFLKTGNVDVETDVVFSTASYMPIYTFLTLKLHDGKTVLSHLECNSDLITEEFAVAEINYEEIRDNLLKIKSSSSLLVTDERVKQVYFPVNSGYHLLSILTPSGVMFAFKKRVDDIRYSSIFKENRKKKSENKYSEHGFDEIYGVTIQGHIKSKPQCISELNNKNHGIITLLSSMPPFLEKRHLHLPKRNFFTDSLWYKNFSNEFERLHKEIFLAIKNNCKIRSKRDKWLQFIIDKVINKMWSIRSAEPGWSAKDNCRLPSYQKTWLDNAHQTKREKETEWLEEVINDFARWVIDTYEKVIGKKAKLLDDKVLDHIKELIKDKEFINENQEGLK